VPSYGQIDADYARRLRETAPDADGPLYTLGLRKLLPSTDTSPRGLPAVGREGADYGSIPLMSSVGAGLCLFASVLASSPSWSQVAVHSFPSRRSVLELEERREFRAWRAQLEESTERIMVLCTLPTGELPAANGQRLLLEVWNGQEPSPLVPGPASRFDVEGTFMGDGRQWSGVRYTAIAPGTALPLHPARFGYQALLLEPVLERWR
jgi:hypothetical protein